MDLTINIPGLSELAASISALAQAMGGQAVNTGAPAVQTAPAPGPNLTLVQPPPQPTAVPVTQQYPVGHAPVAPPVAPAPVEVPTTPQSYSLEQLAVAATQLMDAGRRMDLVTLLGQFGVQALTALPKEHYGTFATQLRAMGAKI